LKSIDALILQLDVVVTRALGDNVAGRGEWKSLIRLAGKPGGATGTSTDVSGPAALVA
jgi:hypothetical protein